MTTPKRAPSPNSERGSGGEVKLRGGASCLVALGVGALLILLVGVALFLPPLSLLDKWSAASQYHALNTASPSLTTSTGLMVRLNSASSVDSASVSLNTFSQDSFFVTSTEGDVTLGDLARKPRAALSAAMKPVSAVYQVQVCDAAPDLQILLPVPSNTDSAQLDVYGYDEGTNRWIFLPAIASEDRTARIVTIAKGQKIPNWIAFFRLSRLVPLVSTTIEIGQTLTPKMGELVNIVHPAGLQPNNTGALQGVLPAGIEFGKNYAVVPVIRNFTDPAAPDVATLTTILQNNSLRETHIMRLIEFATSKPYKGLAIDYRGVPSSLRQRYTEFISALAGRLHNANLTLTLDIPSSSPFDVNSAYDWQALGAATDVMEINWALFPEHVESNLPLESLLSWAYTVVNRTKLQIGLSTQSVQQVGDTFKSISYAEAVAPLGSVTVQQVGAVLPGQSIEVHLNGTNARFNPGETPSISYLDASGAVSSTVWLATESALRARLKRISDANMGGVLLTDLAAPGAAVDALSLVSAYKTGAAMPDSLPNPLALRWTAQQGGKIAATAISDLGTPLVFKPNDSASSAQISAELSSADGMQPTLGAVSIAVASATLTPSITPTPSVTPIPSSTPTRAPTQPPPAPPVSSTAKAAVAPAVSGHVTGGFELGGQVQDLNAGTQTAMHRAGMKWVKRQVQMGDGNGAGLIGQAHGAGFKILLSVVGNKDALLQGGYFDQYASYVGSLAGAGADAIEVWNEMNIDREWPTGKIDPKLYTQLLAKAYNAIKSAHGSTIVVSGALAPTGAEGAFGLGRVWNDDHYYAGMAAAGAANYADCIGVHYNEGVVSPNQTSGDPRDNYPTRYFATMLNRAASPFGGKQVCFTELGYLSPEGYSSAPAGFEWGQNTSIAQQAAWLAQAAVKASGSGRVRLMIVFNVDFTFYGADPQAGYAMIRRGGGCPACDALGQVVR